MYGEEIKILKEAVVARLKIFHYSFKRLREIEKEPIQDSR
jgi:hypothetical protein